MSETHRRFHTLRHVVEVCRTYLEISPDPDWRAEGLFAAFYHDIVYKVDPEQPVRDNESQSAAVAAQALLQMGLFDRQVALVIEMILRTENHHYPGPQNSIKGFLDADMSILGAGSPRYEEYVQELREEYSAVPDERWREGRAGFLRKTLAYDSIYYLPEAKELFEDAARRNMQDELSKLEQF